MVDQAEFLRYVEQALSLLHDRSYLQTHPLARLLGEPGRPLSAESLHRLLIEEIEALRPLEPAPSRGATWRRYHYLRLRYVEGLGHEQAARELAVSVRQARRDHADGLREVSARLWERLAARAEGSGEAARGQAEPAPEQSGARELEVELAKVTSEAPAEPIALDEVLAGTLQLIAPLARSRGIRLELEPHPELPRLAVNRVVLRQILVGLLGYLVELAGEGQVTIAVDEAPSGQAVHLTLAGRRRDPNAGHAPSEGDAPLEAALRLAESQRAALRLTSGPGGNPTVELTLPAVRPRTVLVIDDNPDIGWLFGRYLEGTDYRLIVARTAPRALSLAQEARPDAIVLDLMMPTQDGWEILQALRSKPETSAVPVIVCSVLPERTVAMALGVADFVPKPVTQEALLSSLDRCLSGQTASGGHPGSR